MVEGAHGPLSIHHYQLDVADALAFERLPGEWSVWSKVAFILPVMAVGAIAGLLDDWTGWWWWGLVGGLLLLWAVVGLFVYNWRMHRRAKSRASHEGQTEVEEWNEHLVVRSQAGAMKLANEEIGKVITTDDHVFVLYRGGEVILPLRAFESLEAMRAFGEAVDKRSMDAVP